ncbi:argininosuccinate lyase [Colletotrichum zoysiae]|uniref:Arginosuccinase n=1 Tax=Colletotrichum zoysiae TaxID=1216348 RepID=A0AAD9HFF4_9PEZI|nr:argininosuccinate lyase [Colletotrichum zoysiae]
MASSSKPAKNKLGGGLFTGGLDPLMEYIAFARANYNNGILNQHEFEEIERGLLEVEKEWEAGEFKIVQGDEDIHTANERRLGEVIGKDIAGKLHTGRSRNEQVVCAMRLWLRDELIKLEGHLISFFKVTAARAEKEIDCIMPGYTHLQRAQPVRWSHWMLSYAMAFANDLERLREVNKRVNRNPLGCGALAGNPFNIDREAISKELGLEGLLWNSMAGVADRDFVTETLQWGSILMQHISRWAEDLIIYSSGEFGFFGIRGKSGRVFGQMAGFMMTHKGLPSTYNKDLQESWEPMLDHVKTVSDSIQIAEGVLATLDTQPEKMKAALDPFMLATDVADYLVRKGVPFRETHHISGRCVALSEKTDIPMNELSYEQLKAVDERFEADIAETFN